MPLAKKKSRNSKVEINKTANIHSFVANKENIVLDNDGPKLKGFIAKF